MIDHNVISNNKVSFFTLGCKLNFSETSTIAKQLSEIGFVRAKKGEVAGVCIVNTCSVTELADKKSRQIIRKIAKENPGAYVIVTGCYAQLSPEEVSKIPDVDLVLGNAQKLDIPRFLEQLDSEHPSRVITSKTQDISTFTPSCSQDERTRLFLKVQDGCDYYCSYCTIPFARGRSRNGEIESICKQAEEAVEGGAKEIVLTGVNIGDFGKSTGDTFLDLIKALDKTKGNVRIRISSIEPNLLTDEVISFIASSRCFVPHVHLPLQSGCDEVLQLMKRRYDTSLFAARIKKIKEVMPDAFIGVDVIVGTRGETDEYFEKTYNFLSSLPVSQLHVFSYSERRGTQALKIDHKVSAIDKQKRSKRLLELSDIKIKEFYQSQKGTLRTVLFEHTDLRTSIHGFTENYIKVSVPYEESYINNLIEVRLSNLNESDLSYVVE